MIRKIGDEKNYIEFNDILTYGVRKAYDNRNRPNSFKINGGEVGFELNPLDFSKSAEFVLISGCLTKLVENGEVIFDKGGNFRKTVPYEDIANVVENAENLDLMIKELEEKNKLKPMSLEAEKKEEVEAKNE